MHPEFRVEINGKAMADDLWNRLISISVTDSEGSKSDSVDLEFNDGPPKFLEIPSKRAEIRVWGGYRETGVTYFGGFKDGDVTVECLPYKLRISAKGADLSEGLKAKQTRHFDGQSVGDVLGVLAAENGLELQIGPEFASKRFPGNYAAMLDESALSYGRRLADKFGAQFQIKDGKMLVTKNGDATSPAGKLRPRVIVSPQNLVVGSCSFSMTARGAHSGATARYQDQSGAVRRTVREAAPGRRGPDYNIRETFASEEEAREAAASRAREMSAKIETAECTIVGNVLARGGALFVFENIRPQLDGREFVIETATHTFDKSGGYATQISAKSKP